MRRPSSRAIFIFRLVSSVIFFCAYAAGSFACYHAGDHNIFGVAGFGTTALVIALYGSIVVMMGFSKNTRDTLRASDIAKKGEACSTLQERCPHAAAAASEQQLLGHNASEGDAEHPCVYKRHPRTFIVCFSVLSFAALAASAACLAMGIHGGEGYNIRSPFMGFMGFLMAAKWFLFIVLLMRAARKEAMARDVLCPRA